MCRKKFILLLIAGWLAGAELSAVPVSETEYGQLRQQARERRRKVVLNNDGCDIFYYPEKKAISRENFLSLRTSFLAGKCDTLMYCPISAGQGHFTLELPGADFLTASNPRKNSHNIAGILKAQNQDYFQWLIDFCRQNKMEIFFSFRFNDTHDVKHRPGKPSVFFSKFKDQHRELLFGKDHTSSPRNGWWTSLDFSKPEVRQRQLALVKAVLDKYDVDGIDLDFSRYLKIFPRTASGQPASAEEVKMMTALIRDIRKVLDEKGRAAGKAVLLSVVLPDDIALCRNLGYDIEAYFRENLVDIWLQADSFQLRPIAENAAFAHRYGVKYYAFNGSPYPYNNRENGSCLNRAAVSGYAGRYANAVDGGADGVYLYNISNADSFSLASAMPVTAVRYYFVTPYTWEIPRGYCYSREDYHRYSQLTAHVKCTIVPGLAKTFPMEINSVLPEDAENTLFIDRTGGTAGNVRAAVNGVELPKLKTIDRYECFKVPAGVLKKGMNQLEIGAVSNSCDKGIKYFKAAKLRDFETGVFGTAKRKDVTFKNGIFTVRSTGSAGLLKRFANLEFRSLDFSFDARLVDKYSIVRVTNNGNLVELQLAPGRIVLAGNDFSMPLDTAQFHRFDITVAVNDAVLKIDGKEVFRSNKLRSAFAFKANTWLPESARIYGLSASLVTGVPEKGGTVEFKNITVTAPPGSVQIANCMLSSQLPAVSGQNITSGIWRNGKGLTAKRILDGRALPFRAAPGKKVLGAEMVLRPGDRRSLWVVSDGSKVCGWIVTRTAVLLWPGKQIGIAINDGSAADRYQMFFVNGEVQLLRNGKLFYTTGTNGRAFYRDGEFFSVPEVQTVEEFLAEHGRRFTAAEQKMIRSGGTLTRGLREYSEKSAAELLSLRLLEK